MSLKFVVRWGGEILLVIAVIMGVMVWKERHLLSDNSQAPAFDLVTLAGTGSEPIYGNNDPTVVYFFAPWCSACRMSMSNLNALQGGFKIKAVALSYDNVAEIEQFVQEVGVDLPILLGNDEVQKAYHISGFPTYYVLDEQGIILSKSMGYSSELGLKIRTLLNAS